MSRRTRAELVPTDGVLAEVIAERIKTFRGKRMSAEKLAERCRTVGLQWDRQVIANLESGRRGLVTVGEWLALSYALSVPPLALLLPIGDADTVEVVPGVSIHPDLARQWITGDVLRSQLPGNNLDEQGQQRVRRRALARLRDEHRQRYAQLYQEELIVEEMP